MQVSDGEYVALFGSGTLSVFHPALTRPAEYVARPFDDCESQLRAAIDYTRANIVERTS